MPVQLSQVVLCTLHLESSLTCSTRDLLLPRFSCEVMKIVIVGAGPGGLGAARHCQEYFPSAELLVFERYSCLGGIWRGDNQSPVYRDLHTNLPMELMAFPDFPAENSNNSFVHHSEVRKYLKHYSQNFNLEQVKSLFVLVVVVWCRMSRKN